MDFILPLIFMAIMGLAMLLYVILDGYDLGVGILLHYAPEEHKDMMAIKMRGRMKSISVARYVDNIVRG